MASTDARPIPIKNTAYRVTFPILDADGDLVTGASGLDSEVSKDAGTFVDCTNEATEIATASGMYYLDLTSTEMNADCVAIIVKTSTSGAKTVPIVLYPQESGDIKVDIQSFGGTDGTFAGGRPEVNMTHIAGASVSTSTAQLGVNVVNAAGTAWLSGAITAASIAPDAIGASELAADAVAEIQSGLMLASSYTAPLSAAGTRTALGMASANLDTQLGLLATAANLATLTGYVDTEVAAIKAKTDSLTFTVAGQLDANIQYVNDVQVNGTGTAGNPWSP